MERYFTYKGEVLGKGFDVDKYFGDQCWDGYAHYCIYLGVPYANCTASGYAKDIWEQRQKNGMLNNFDEVTEMESGDIAIFKEVADWTPVSHVAIFDSDAGNGYGWFLGQNQGGKQTNPAGGGVYNLVKLPYSATYPTAFRLKKKPAKKANDFLVRVSIQNLNVRQAPSLSAKRTGFAKTGVYTIVETKEADGYEWGKLKSGIGWIALKYTSKL